MDKFVYVFSKENRDTLEKLGYSLLKEDIRNNVYVFLNKDELSFSRLDMSYITSSTLTF